MPRLTPRITPLIDFIEEQQLLDRENLPEAFKPLHRPQQIYLRKIKRRMIIGILSLATIFVIPAYRLSELAMNSSWQAIADATDGKIMMPAPALENIVPRGKIYDRTGFLLAGNLPTVSLVVNPNNILNPDATASKLTSLFPYLEKKTLLKQFQERANRRIILVQNLDPVIKRSVLDIGEPGLELMDDSKRFYPSNSHGAVTIGFVAPNNKGIMGLERFFDKELTAGKDVSLSLDSRVQNFLDEELSVAAAEHKASAAGGVVMDIQNGEILGLSSLPGFNPNNRTKLDINNTFNMMIGGSYELGSVMKIITIAKWLDAQPVQPPMTDKSQLGKEPWRKKLWDVTVPLSIDDYTISDMHPIDRPITSDEIFIYSSNIGTILLTNDVLASNSNAQRDFLRSLHLLSKIELPFSDQEVAKPIAPKNWGRIESGTISFGHGLSLPPLQFATAVAALLGDGVWRAPSFRVTHHDNNTALDNQPKETVSNALMAVLPTSWQDKMASWLLGRDTAVSEQHKKNGPEIVKSTTREELRRLLRLNVLYGSGRRINQTGVAGYEIGGKTGTAEKTLNGQYDKGKNLTSFIAVFPVSKPRYLVFLLLDNTQKGDLASATLTPATGRLIGKIAPLLPLIPNRNVEKNHDNDYQAISNIKDLTKNAGQQDASREVKTAPKKQAKQAVKR